MSTVLTERRSPELDITADDEGIALAGDLDIRTLPEAERVISEKLAKCGASAIDLRNLSGLDTPGALFLRGLRDRGIELTGARLEHKSLDRKSVV